MKFVEAIDGTLITLDAIETIGPALKGVSTRLVTTARGGKHSVSGEELDAILNETPAEHAAAETGGSDAA